MALGEGLPLLRHNVARARVEHWGCDRMIELKLHATECYTNMCCSSSYLVAVAEAVPLRGALTQDEEQAAAEAGGCVRVVAQLLRNAVHRAEPDPRHLCK